MPKYRLPDPLADLSSRGRRIATAQEWTAKQRPTLMRLFRENVYGVRPATEYDIEYKEVGRRVNAFGIGATARQIRATIRVGRKSHSFDFVLVVPKSEKPVPVIVHINNRYLIPLDKAVDEFDPFWPVEKIVGRGYATAGFHTSHVDPDRRDGYEAGIRSLLDDPSSDPDTRWRSISAWAWGASRVLDFAIKQPQIDPERTVVAGNSRAGKTALWAGAEDQRFRIVYSNESGCGGAALSRRAFGETVARITQVFPHWFCERFKSYGGREAELPIDQHQLIALTAPRAVYVASADEDLWADPRGEYAALIAAGPVFDLFGLKHITDPKMPALNTPRHVGSTGYHIRTGVHNLTEQDWGYFLDYADRVFGKRQRAKTDLAAGFADPPDAVKPSGYWWWLNANVDEEAITRDMEQFKAKGIGAVLLVSSGQWSGPPIPKGPPFLSPRWRELFRHALREAHRVGIKVDVNIAPGWNMGGPWVTPEKACRWFLQSETTLVGPQRYSGKLPLPGGRDGYDSKPMLGVRTYIDLPIEEVDYRDTAVVAFRTPGGGAKPTPRDDLPAKSNRVDADCFKPVAEVMAQTLGPWEASRNDMPLRVEEVVDLTSKLQPDGTLRWDVPEGEWTVVRTGHRMTGAKLSVPMPGQEGLENDYLDRAGVELMFEKVGKILIEDAGPLVGKSLRGFCSDSFECGYPNWTANMIERFKQYRGYDPVPYLPVFRGWIVGSADVSERFLYDYRKTVADCMADEHYGRFTELCRAEGLMTRCEAAGPSWSSTMCMDGLKNLGRVDFPQGEFWRGKFLQGGQNMVGKQTASAAHIYGKRTASAEAFTSVRGHWSASPELLKPDADRAFCEGINNFVFHTLTCQRPQDGKPGIEYGAGTHFNPNITWWELGAGAWLDYVNRCQFLLQSGLFVADVLYYNGDWAPNLVGPKFVDPGLGKGYDYDVCNAEVLLDRLSVDNGRLVLPDGMSYRVLVLPDRKTMPVEVLAKIKQLVEAGATVVGPRSEKDPGLKDYPRCDARVKAMAAELWGDCDGSMVRQNMFGRGRVVWGKKLREVLSERGIGPDFEYTGEASDTFLDFIHRRTERADIYMVANRLPRAERVECSFQIEGKRPEFWDPVGGTIADAPVFRQKEGRTIVPMEFAPHGSMFVVFRRPTSRRTAGNINDPFPERSTVQQLGGPWTVRFDPEWGPGEPIVFDTLTSWTEHDDPRIKYYSGKATYKTVFDLSEVDSKKTRLWLDLGQPKNLAAVRLNGKNLGVVWTAPFHVEITDAVRPKDNRLEIDVVNLWPNRLIGDAGLPREERRTRTNVTRFKKDMPLLPSGLLGPVSVVKSSVRANNADDKNRTAPNIVLILVDDVGYCDVGAFAAQLNKTTTDRLYYETPRIDALAKQGTMFTQFYACTVCAPTRASLMTGKMSNRMGMWDAYATVRTTFEKTGKPVPEGCHVLDNEPWDEYRYGKTDRGVSVPIAATALHDVKTIPQGLHGYHSAFIGKWHMGSHNHEGYRPADQGFDEVLAYFDGGGSGYHRPFRAYAARTPHWDMPGPTLTPRQDYLSDDVAQRTGRFLEDRAKNHSGEPFFLYVAHPACHGPVQSRADDLRYFREKAKTPGQIGHKSPEYAGLVKGMDRSVGAILDKLDELDLTDNTAVLFISDNGGHPVFTRNTPLRGGKSMLYEGGIRVPMIVRWPGRTEPGTVCDVASDITDIYPTLMEIAGVDYGDFEANDTTDGQTLTPLFDDPTNAARGYTRDEFYHFYGKMGYKGHHDFATWATLRKGDYKLHYDYHGKVELYNIAEDVSEKTDLVETQPKLAHDMLVRLTQWLEANCNEAYLPQRNPRFDPNGKLPYGPYVPIDRLKASLLNAE